MLGGIANSEARVPIRMLLKLCFDAHCLVARFRGYTCSEVKLRHAVTTLSKAIDKLSFCT